RIEAVARTPIMGFRDDIVVRIRPAEDGARVDIRSASRYGRHDFGANASRVRSLSEDVDDIAGAEKPKPKPPPKPAPQKGPAPRAPRRRGRGNRSSPGAARAFAARPCSRSWRRRAAPPPWSTTP